MSSWAKRCFDWCRKRIASNVDDDGGSTADRLLWSKDIERRASMAIVKANRLFEDQSLLVARNDFTFFGMNDCGGPDGACQICKHIYEHLTWLSQQQESLPEETIAVALNESEGAFRYIIHKAIDARPLIASFGSSILVAAIYRGMLYMGSVGNSKAVMGMLSLFNKVKSLQLTKDTKGGYFKSGEFAVPKPDVSVISRALTPDDKFVIFASDGFWDHISNQQAVQTVQKHPHAGIATRLAKMAVKEAARKAGIGYRCLKLMQNGPRR